jgi:hypothetical protein
LGSCSPVSSSLPKVLHSAFSSTQSGWRTKLCPHLCDQQHLQCMACNLGH